MLFNNLLDAPEGGLQGRTWHFNNLLIKLSAVLDDMLK